jgi:hypothetical protein
MSGHRSAVIALAVIAAGAVVAVLVMLARVGFATATPLPRATDSAWPLATAPPATVPPVSSVAPPASASPSAVRASAAPAAPTLPVAEGAPAPFVQTFAAQPGVRPQPAKPSPTATLPVTANVDGCDHAYGTRTQCVPLTFPGGVTSVAGKCAWLAANGFTDLTVVGTDHQKLDENANGIACDG